MARIVGDKTGAIAPNKAVASSRGKGKTTSGPGSREPKQKPQVTAFNEATVEAINKAGPKGHEVAHINPREGRILEALGGSGKKDPETKIKSYERVVGKKTAKDSKLPKGKGRGRVDSTHQVAVLTDPEVEALNTMRWRDKDRGYSSGSGPEIMALADQNDRPFDFLEYRGEVIPTLNNGGDENVKGDGSGGYTYSGGDGGNGGNGGYTESAWAKKKRLEKEARDREEAAQKERDRIAKLKADADKKVQDAIKAAEKKEKERLDRIQKENDRIEKRRKEKERIAAKAAAKAEKDRLAALEATRVEEERIQKEEDDRLAKEAQEEADRVVAEAEEKERIEKEAEDKAQEKYEADLAQDKLDAEALQEEIKETDERYEQQFDESDDFLEGEGEFEGDETDTPYYEEGGRTFDLLDQLDAQDEDILDLEGELPEQDTGSYYDDFDFESGDRIGGDVVSGGEEKKIWGHVSGLEGASSTDMYGEGDWSPDDEAYDSSQDDPSGEADPDFWSDPGEYAGGDDWLEGEGEWGLEEDPYAGDDESGAKDSETLEEEAEDAESDLQFLEDAPDDDDTDTFDDSGQDDPADITPDDDDTDTYDQSQDDPSGTDYEGGVMDDDPWDDTDEGFEWWEEGGSGIDPGTEGGGLDWDQDEGFDGDDGGGDGGGGDGGGGDGDDQGGGVETGGGPDTGGPTGETDQEKLLADLEEKYEEYGETDYEALFKGEFEDDLKQDYDASTRSAERAYLTSGDLSEFNTTGNTINDQLLALEESFEGEEKDYLDEMSANYATGPKKAIEEWYKRQRKAILRGEVDSIEELDLSEWSDPSDEYDPEFFKDVEYSKLYENMEGDTVAQDESGDYYDREDQDPHTDWFEDDTVMDDNDPDMWDDVLDTGGIDPNKGPDPLELDTDPNIPDPTEESSGDDPVPDDFEDEGDDQMGDFGDETLGGVDFGDEFPVTEGDQISVGPTEGVDDNSPVGDGTDYTYTPIEESERQWSWIDDDRVPSQAEIDFYAGQEGGGGEVTQDHVDELQEGLGITPGSDDYIYYDETNLGGGDDTTESESLSYNPGNSGGGSDPVPDLFEDEGTGADGMGGDGMDWGMGDTNPASDTFDMYEDISSGGSGLTEGDMYDEVDSLNEAEGLNPGDDGYIWKDDFYTPSNDTFGGFYDTNTFDMSNPDAWMEAPKAKPKDTRVSNKTKPLRPSQRPRRGGGGSYSSYGPR